jgi:hypothetical protein
MQPATIGQYLLNQALPEEYRDMNRVMDSKTANSLFSKMAMEHPDEYSDVMFKLNKLAVEAQSSRGGLSPSARHFRESPTWQRYRDMLRSEVKRIYADPSLSSDAKRNAVSEKLSALSSRMSKEIYDEVDKANSPVAWIVKSGAKGKPANVNNILGSPLLFADAKGRLVPIPIMSGYAKGLSPSEYWAASYGTRKGAIDTKLSVADGGFLSKQLTQIAHRSVVTDDDDPDNLQDESRGLPVDLDDDDNIGALLARPVGDYGRNTIITAKVLRNLRRQGIKRILVRSPIVGGPQDGGVYAKDVGLREMGRLPVRGENPGVSAAQALGEPISQSMLSSKHCMSETTMVRMWDGSVKCVAEIIPGDVVVGVEYNCVLNKKCIECGWCETHNEDGGVLVPATVTNVFFNGVQDVVTVPFAYPDKEYKDVDIKYLEATTNHTILAYYDGAEDFLHLLDYHAADPDLLDREECTEEELGNIMSQRHCFTAVTYDFENSVQKNAEMRCAGRQTYRLYHNAEIERKRRRVYDLEIDTENHLFLLANGLVSHNSAGVAGNSAGAIGGFAAINQLVQVPKESLNWAAHSRVDGTVRGIEKAPQGGHYVRVDDASVYVAPGHEVTVKQGDEIEAGDILSTGLPNPSIVVEHKGIGEGRRYFTQAMMKTLRSSGVQANRRNVELLARGLVNHVELDDEMDAYVPGDEVPYNMLEKFYQPRKDAQELPIDRAIGKYLERPVLHYTIGTKIRPSVQRDLEEFGLADNILVHDNPPPFHAKMVRGMAIASKDPDWIASMQGSGIKSRLMEAVHRGHYSNPKGTSYVSGIVADPNFGAGNSGGKITAPLLRLNEMKQRRLEAPANPFDLSDDDDD